MSWLNRLKLLSGIVVIVLIVQVIQWVGDMLSRLADHR